MLPYHKNALTLFSRSKSSSEFQTVTTGRRAFQLYVYTSLAKQPAMHPSYSLYLKQTLRDICILAFTK